MLREEDKASTKKKGKQILEKETRFGAV